MAKPLDEEEDGRSIFDCAARLKLLTRWLLNRSLGHITVDSIRFAPTMTVFQILWFGRIQKITSCSRINS